MSTPTARRPPGPMVLDRLADLWPRRCPHPAEAPALQDHRWSAARRFWSRPTPTYGVLLAAQAAGPVRCPRTWPHAWRTRSRPAWPPAASREPCPLDQAPERRNAVSSPPRRGPGGDDDRPHRTRRWLAVVGGVVVAGIVAAVRSRAPPRETRGLTATSTNRQPPPGSASSRDDHPGLLRHRHRLHEEHARRPDGAAQRARRLRRAGADRQKAPRGRSPGPTVGGGGRQPVLRDPAALRACLQAIDAAGVRPLAVGPGPLPGP